MALPDTHRRRPPAWLIFLALTVAITVLSVLSGSPAVALAAQVGVGAASTLLLGGAWWRERRRGRDADPLIGLAFLALLPYTLATVAFAGWPVALGLVLPVPSVVDAMYFLSYALFGVLLWRLGSRSQAEGRHQFLDTLIVALGVTPVIGVRLVEPQLVGGPITAAQLVYLAYPVAVSVLLGLTIRLAFRAHRSSTPYFLLGGWISLELAADLVFLDKGVAGTYVYGQSWQALWVLSAGCVGALVLHPGTRAMLQPRRSPPVRGRHRLYIIGGALTGPMIGDEMGERADGFILAVGLVLVVAVCLRLSGLMIDVAEQRRGQYELLQLSESLSHQALHDPLTGLANRALLNERLSDVRAVSALTSVLLLDVDDFKLVNDSLGHDVGDQLLVEVARRMDRELRADDRAGRLGGDEFVVLLANADAAHAEIVAERLLVSLAQPMMLGAIEVSVSVSIGIATSSDVPAELNLLGAADMAMYQAKERGKAGTAVFEPHMQQSAAERLSLDVDLRRALRDEELFLAYQPIVDLKTGALAGVEALVRWRDSRRGLVSPELFVPIAERTGLIVPLGAWVLRESVRQLGCWDRQAPQSRLVMNVNISTRQLERPGLLAVVDELIADGLDPARLVLEITETALTLDGEAADETLHQLRRRGVRLAVDDFGTGYSSLSRLQAAPVSQLKIDQSFVSAIHTSASVVPIIHATVAMADGLGLGVIAEGVETAAQLRYLRRLGCAQAQGYLLARPKDAAGITGMLAGPLPWAGLLGGPSVDPLSEPAVRRAPLRSVSGYTRPPQVVEAAEAIAATAAAEVAADAARTAQAAVTAACAAALKAARKAERVATQAAEAAAAAAAALAAARSDQQLDSPWHVAAAADHAACYDGSGVDDAAREVSTSRTAHAAAAAARKVAAEVEAVAAAVLVAGAEAAGLIELRLAEDAADAALLLSLTGPAATTGTTDRSWC